MPFDIGPHERTLRHDFQPLGADRFESRPDQSAADAASFECRRHDGVREGDDRGHLIGHQFNGSDRMENMVPQDWRINQKSFKKLEDSLAGQVETGHDVSVSVIPFYGGDSRRPDGIFYFYNIDGVSNVVLFPNDVSEEET